MKKLFVLFAIGLALHAPLYSAQPKSINKQLINAAKKGDVLKVEKLIGAGADVNFSTLNMLGREKTALMHAAEGAYLDVMDVLIKNGADVNEYAEGGQPFIGHPVLHYAIDSESVEAVRRLLSAGADPNKTTHFNTHFVNETSSQLIMERNMPLITYAINKDADLAIINALIQGRGANVNQLGLRGQETATPLMLAVIKKNELAVEALLNAGADKNLANKFDDNKTALDYASEGGSASILNALTRARITSPQKRKAAIGVAALTVAALTAAVTGYITKRLYQNKKKRLVKKYKLGNLTKLQDKIWLATTLASYGVPQRLRSLVRNNPGALASFTGKDPRALAELYYGHAPSQKELDVFIQKFFAGVQ